MQTLQELLNELLKVNREIKRIIKNSKFDIYDDLSGLNIDYDDSEQRFLLNELIHSMYSLEKASNILDYLNKPITGEYTLHKNSTGRYECGIREFSSGSMVECLVYDEFDERYNWIYTGIEHNGTDYYLTAAKNTPLEGLKIRLRG